MICRQLFLSFDVANVLVSPNYIVTLLCNSEFVV